MSTRQKPITQRRLDILHGHPQFPAADAILKKLQADGHKAVFAGGCVRDSLLGKAPKDLDIATSAGPDLVEATFARTLAVGKAFGTIVVLEGEFSFEVTTFRRDGPYLDGRHPSHVEFSDMEEDAKRRDFTINALFYDPQTCLVYDYVEGLLDLERRHLRTVGRAEERFQEDRLRMLRAARFVAQLGFTLDEDASEAICKLRSGLKEVSVERVFNEMKRLLGADFLIQGLSVLRDCQMDEILWPELARIDLPRMNAFLPLQNWENAFAAVTSLADESSGEARLRAWKAPRESMKRVDLQLRALQVLKKPNSTRAERILALGGECYAETLQLAKGHVGESIVQKWIQEFLSASGGTANLPKAFLTGQDLIANGVAPGESMGRVLKKLYEEQLEGGLTSREAALQRLKTIKV